MQESPAELSGQLFEKSESRNEEVNHRSIEHSNGFLTSISAAHLIVLVVVTDGSSVICSPHTTVSIQPACNSPGDITFDLPERFFRKIYTFSEKRPRRNRRGITFNRLGDPRMCSLEPSGKLENIFIGHADTPGDIKSQLFLPRRVDAVAFWCKVIVSKFESNDFA